MTTRVLPPASSSGDVESSGYTRLALLSGVCSWMLALVRFGLAVARHEVGIDPVLALGVAIGLPALVLFRAAAARQNVRFARGENERAVVIPFPVRRATQGRRAS